MTFAKYKCLSCNHEWQQVPSPTHCPSCQHEYLLWTNYEEMFVKNKKKG